MMPRAKNIENRGKLRITHIHKKYSHTILECKTAQSKYYYKHNPFGQFKYSIQRGVILCVPRAVGREYK